MIIDLLFSHPALFVVYAVALVSSLTVHEFAHALVGTLRGDATAQHMGRLTLNPLAHLDIFGTMMLFFVGFGWAKPVPFDPKNLRHPLTDGIIIALAGPCANLLFGSVAALTLAAGVRQGWLIQAGMLPDFLLILVMVNFSLLLFNLIPIPPLDGSHVLDAILYKARLGRARMLLEVYGPQLLLILVLLSQFTSLDPFGFIYRFSGLACNVLTGFSCF